MFKEQFIANGSCYEYSGNPYAASTIKEIREDESNRRYYKNLGEGYSTKMFESSLKSKLRHLTNFGEVRKLY